MSVYFENLEIERPSYLGGEKWELKGLNEITVLFGKNGSGKSILLRNLSKSAPETYHYACPERAGDIRHQYNLVQEQLNPAGRSKRRQQNLAPQFRDEVIAKIQVVLGKLGNLAGRGQEVTIDLKDIETILNRLLVDFTFRITGEDPPFKLTRISSGEDVNTVGALSSGETESLTLALDLLTMCAIWELDKQDQRVLLVDEPDTHLHPDLQQELGIFMVSLLDTFNVQVIVATHSTTLLSALGLHGGYRTNVIFLNSLSPVQNTIKFDEYLQELSACLGGHVLMGPLFGAPLLLVEGDDDYKIWGQVPRHHVVNLAVIPCAGEHIFRYQKTLGKVFESLRSNPVDPVGFALLDGDRGLPQPQPDNPQKHIKYIQLSCHESEDLYLTDEVLQEMETDWESAKTMIKEKSHLYGEKQAALEKCDSWDRKNEVIKDIIDQLTYILDDKGLPWTLRVAKCIGSRKPTGQLADFLGPGVLEALWDTEPI